MTSSYTRYAVLMLLAMLYLGYAATASAGYVASQDSLLAYERRSAPIPGPKIGPNDYAGFEVVWYGTYNVSDMKRIEDSNAPAESRGIVMDNQAPLQDRATMRIPAKAGNNFGVAFRFRDASEESPVDYRAIWRFPRPGLTNPKNGKTFLEYTSSSSECRGNLCVYGWSLSEPWEIVTGTWKLELWRGTRKLHEQLFELVKP